MNIAFVNATVRWGGVKTWYLEFAERLAQRGNLVRVYGRQEAFVQAAQERVGHGETARFGADLNPATVYRFYRLFREQQIDVVIVNIEKDLATAGVAARLAGIPVVQRIGLPNDVPLRLKTRLLHRWIRPTFLCPCRFIADGFCASLPYVRESDVHVVLNGKKASSVPLELHHPRRLVCTQQLVDDKGHATLLHAAAGLQKAGLDFSLHIWGTGQSGDQLKALSTQLGLQDKVFWHGFSAHIMEDLQQGDVFLLASLSEGLPNTLLEGMAAGLLPISRHVGGVKEVLPQAFAPWTLPYAATAEDFQRVLHAALALPDAELLRLRELARATCKATFDIDTQAAQLESWLMRFKRR
ncbi:MAG: glycosyltransferase [Bilophila sp.]